MSTFLSAGLEPWLRILVGSGDRPQQSPVHGTQGSRSECARRCTGEDKNGQRSIHTGEVCDSQTIFNISSRIEVLHVGYHKKCLFLAVMTKL